MKDIAETFRTRDLYLGNGDREKLILEMTIFTY